MPEISYFTEYSQRENQITNNTILMFRHVYNESPKLFNEFLCSLLAYDNIDFRVNFSQQDKSSDSIPDALISQKASNIYFEFKPADHKDENQIERHITSIKQSDVKDSSILLYVTVNKIIDNEKDYGLPVFFITYNDIFENLDSTCPVYLYNLKEIIETYRNMLENQGLLPIDYQMVSVPCGRSWKNNFELKKYEHPIDRHFRKNTKYIGIYNDKKIKYIGQIEHTITVTNETGIRCYHTNKEVKDSGIINRINEINKTLNLTIFLFDEIYEVNIEKTSKGGLQARKYFDLLKDFKILKDSFDGFKELCDKLKGKSFE